VGRRAALPASEGAGAGLDIREEGGALTLRVRVQPRAAREEVAGVRGGALLVRLTAPPVEGAANEALARFLGKRLGVPHSAVRLLRGEKGRDKRLRIAGVRAGDVIGLLVPR
jgi:uncharacterized protein (TIGR00251 family)